MLEMILFLIVFGILALVAQIMLIPVSKLSYVCIGIQLGCLTFQFYNLIQYLMRRNPMAKKLMCDLCNKDLVQKPKDLESGIAALFSEFSIFKIKSVYKVTKFTMQIPFAGNRNEMDMCETCMQDFKEFVQRKKSYCAGDK